MKTPKERDTLDLLELVCQLHSRSLNAGTKAMHDAYVEARQELESRIVANNNFVLAPVSGSLPCHHNFIQKDTYWKSCTHCGMTAPLGQ
jgi:hypothetical protein